MTLPRRMTYEEYRNLPGDDRYELVEGELLLTPAPSNRHQAVLGNIYFGLRLFLAERRLPAPRVAPLDVILADHTVLQPDLLYVSRERSAIVDPDGGTHGAPDLVVEILSPSTASRDLVVKRQLYGQYGVREYWIVDPKERSIEVLTQQGEGLETWQRFEETESLTSPLFPAFRLDLAAVFQEE